MSERTSYRIGVVGAGSWGTALASLLAKGGHEVRLWSWEKEVVEEIRTSRENRRYLPEITLPASLWATDDLPAAVSDSEVLLSVSPSQHVREVMRAAAPHIGESTLVVSASKGIEISTLLTMDQLLGSILPPALMERFSVLSGPSFAIELAREMPTAVTVASRAPEARLLAQGIFQTRYCRVYTSPDVIGVELGGALKNVIALAAGVVAGMEFGQNARAALITRGLAEITRLGEAMGASRATFAGLAGMGDLMLTCTSGLSRNRTVGFRLGRGETLADILGK